MGRYKSNTFFIIFDIITQKNYTLFLGDNT